VLWFQFQPSLLCKNARSRWNSGREVRVRVLMWPQSNKQLLQKCNRHFQWLLQTYLICKLNLRSTICT
jgi:hypothetical protein